MDPFWAFISGVGVSLTAALIANILTRERERKRIIEERRFSIYMKLMNLHGLYFFFYSCEERSAPLAPQIKQQVKDLAWQIADLLRSADEIKHLDEILDVLFAPTFNTAKDRYHAMKALINKLGQDINPRYTKKMRSISESNIEYLATGHRPNAPGFDALIH